MNLRFNLNQIEDECVRDNLRQLLQFLREVPFLSGSFKAFEEVITRPSTTYKIKHLLGFQPTDVLLTWVSDNSAVSVNYKLTDKDYIVLNVSSKCTVRFLAGSVPKNQEI